MRKGRSSPIMDGAARSRKKKKPAPHSWTPTSHPDTIEILTIDLNPFLLGLPMNDPTRDVQRFLPLKPQDLHILAVLARTNAHGYGIMRSVEHETDGRVRLEVGSLYRLLGRLLDQGLIDEVAAPNDETDARRRHYGITPMGRDVARAETRRLAEFVASPGVRALLEEG